MTAGRRQGDDRLDGGTGDPIWELNSLVGGGDQEALRLIERARHLVSDLSRHRGRIPTLDATELAMVMRDRAEIREVLSRARSYVGLRFAADSTRPENGALLQRVQEDGARITLDLRFVDFEWARLSEVRANQLLADPLLSFCANYLRAVRRNRPHLNSEAEERIHFEKGVTGRAAWVRLYNELTAAIQLEVQAENGRQLAVSLAEGLARLASPDRIVRRNAARAVTVALAPGLATRAFIYNMILLDKAIDDRLRRYPTWISSCNLANETTDEAVDSLISAVLGRLDIPHRWYRLKAALLGLPSLRDYDRLAPVGKDLPLRWSDAEALVLDAYAAFSPALAQVARRFFDERWIDAVPRPGKQLGAFCSYTVPSHHPYIMLNWTGFRGDVLTLAHELGHGVHAYLARVQGIFHQSTPVTLAETASVFGELLVLRRLLEQTTDPNARLGLLAHAIERTIETVFRQTALNRFEHLAHEARRRDGELSIERLGCFWYQTQTAVFGDAVDVSDGYRSWWSYVPHFVESPGYVYAYAFGHLVALSMFRRFQEQGAGFVARYVDLLAAGGALPAEELGRMVGCEFGDPRCWEEGLALVDAQLSEAEAAAMLAGILPRP